ncbi:hypothetical protein F5887DRAFT_915760 [Amanita rubescens]|nr:hypothetical protein F5887DRAFT_915760 [Amanita rubescens]
MSDRVRSPVTTVTRIPFGVVHEGLKKEYLRDSHNDPVNHPTFANYFPDFERIVLYREPLPSQGIRNDGVVAGASVGVVAGASVGSVAGASVGSVTGHTDDGEGVPISLSATKPLPTTAGMFALYLVRSITKPYPARPCPLDPPTTIHNQINHLPLSNPKVKDSMATSSERCRDGGRDGDVEEDVEMVDGELRDEGIEMETLRWRIGNGDEDVEMMDGEMHDEDSEMEDEELGDEDVEMEDRDGDEDAEMEDA